MLINYLDIEKKAAEIRQSYRVQTYGIKDIFNLITQRGIDLIRYTFGKDVLLGFSTVFEGKRVIVTNTSEILSREVFTAAHELGHIIYDFEDSNQNLKIDLNSDEIEDVSETRAFYFANYLLMPEEQLREFIKYELRKQNETLNALDIVRMQIEFNVSYTAMVKRLYDIRLISIEQKNNLFNDRNATTSHVLFKMINVDDGLLNPTNIIKVPVKYIEYVTSNYNNDYIPFSSFQNALTLLGLDATLFRKDPVIEEDGTDLDDLFEEFDE